MMDPAMQAQLDAAARQKGFKNYAVYSAWAANQARMKGVNGSGTAGKVPPRKAAPPPQKNWLQQILGNL